MTFNISLILNYTEDFPNHIHNTTEEYIPYIERLETYIVPVVFGIIFITGLLGNGTLVYIFLRHKAMRSVPNTYIMSLAIGDLIVIVGTVPFISTIYTFDTWPYGQFICKLSEFLRDVSISVTVLTLTVLSVDRYIAIVLPIQKLTGSHVKSLTIFVSISIWFISVAVAIPGAYYSFVREVLIRNEKIIYVCYPFPLSMMPWYPQMMVLLKFLMLYAIPLILIACFYALMARQLLKSIRTTVGKNDSHAKQVRARAKVAKTVLAFAVVFAICFLPNQVFMMWFYFHPNSEQYYNEFWHIWRIFGYVLTFVNSCINPAVLYFISGVFRKYYRRYLCCCNCRSGHNNAKVTLRRIHMSVKSHSLGTTITKI